jgi:hypothetical protein
LFLAVPIKLIFVYNREGQRMSDSIAL